LLWKKSAIDRLAQRAQQCGAIGHEVEPVPPKRPARSDRQRGVEMLEGLDWVARPKVEPRADAGETALTSPVLKTDDGARPA
jgi:hypothetical protein